MGLPLTLLALASVFVSEQSQRRHVFLLLIFVVLYYVFFFAWGWIIACRYVIVIVPICCILGASVCARLFEGRSRFIKVGGVVLTFAVVGLSLYQCATGVYLRLHDTRPPASRYIAQNIPPGTTLGIGSVSEEYTWRAHPWRSPRIDLCKYKEVPFWEEPEFIIVNSNDYGDILVTLAAGKVDEGYALDHRYDSEWMYLSPPTPRVFRLYDDLFNSQHSKYRLLKVFSIPVNVPLEFPPPEIRIYKKLAQRGGA